MNQTAAELICRREQEALESPRSTPATLPTPTATLHHTELPAALPGSPIAEDWEIYRREVGRLLAEGQEGRWLLIANREIVGLWDTEEEANRVRHERFGRQPILMKQILEREPVFRCPRLFHPDVLNPCRS